MPNLDISVHRRRRQKFFPGYSYQDDAAFDLPTAVEVELSPGERKKVPTGLALAIPKGYAGLVLPRSGIADRLGVGVVNSPGLIDAGYRGEVAVILVNLSQETVRFDPGDRIAQLMVVQVPSVRLVEVDRLDETERGEAGFGSTRW